MYYDLCFVLLETPKCFICLLLSGWIDLPEPVKNFHATYVEDTKVTLEWDPLIRDGGVFYVFICE